MCEIPNLDTDVTEVSPVGKKSLGVGCLSGIETKVEKGRGEGGQGKQARETERSWNERGQLSAGKLLAGILLWSSPVFLLNSIPNLCLYECAPFWV